MNEAAAFSRGIQRLFNTPKNQVFQLCLRALKSFRHPVNKSIHHDHYLSQKSSIFKELISCERLPETSAPLHRSHVIGKGSNYYRLPLYRLKTLSQARYTRFYTIRRADVKHQYVVFMIKMRFLKLLKYFCAAIPSMPRSDAMSLALRQSSAWRFISSKSPSGLSSPRQLLRISSWSVGVVYRSSKMDETQYRREIKA